MVKSVAGGKVSLDAGRAAGSNLLHATANTVLQLVPMPVLQQALQGVPVPCFLLQLDLQGSLVAVQEWQGAGAG